MSAAKSFEKQSIFPVPVEELFAWHERPGAFERLCPPWAPVEIVSRDPGLKDGARVSLRVKIAGIPQRLEVIHEAYEAGGVNASAPPGPSNEFWVDFGSQLGTALATFSFKIRGP